MAETQSIWPLSTSNQRRPASRREASAPWLVRRSSTRWTSAAVCSSSSFARALAFAPNGDLFVVRNDRSVHVQLAGTTTWQMIHPFATVDPREASLVYEPFRGVLLYIDDAGSQKFELPAWWARRGEKILDAIG